MPRLTVEVAGETVTVDYTVPSADPGVIPVWGAPVWRDEFDGATIDPAKWNVRASTGDLGILDASEIKREQCFIRDGRLVIQAKWKPTVQSGGPRGIITHDTGYLDHRAKTGGYIFQQQYGRWEIRAKIPTGPNTRGTLPAFWLRTGTSDQGSSKPGEIDIMEAWGGGGAMSSTWTQYTKDTATTTFHSSTTQGVVNGKAYRKSFWRWFEQGIPRDLPAGFHTFAFEYTPTYCALVVDGVERKRITPSSPDPVNKSGSAVNPAGTMAWLWDADFFGAPMHVRLNLHIGPEAGERTPDPNNRAWSADPMEYEIEYVRIYKMP